MFFWPLIQSSLATFVHCFLLSICDDEGKEPPSSPQFCAHKKGERLLMFKQYSGSFSPERHFKKSSPPDAFHLAMVLSESGRRTADDGDLSSMMMLRAGEKEKPHSPRRWASKGERVVDVDLLKLFYSQLRERAEEHHRCCSSNPSSCVSQRFSFDIDMEREIADFASFTATTTPSNNAENVIMPLSLGGEGADCKLVKSPFSDIMEPLCALPLLARDAVDNATFEGVLLSVPFPTLNGTTQRRAFALEHRRLTGSQVDEEAPPSSVFIEKCTFSRVCLETQQTIGWGNLTMENCNGTSDHVATLRDAVTCSLALVIDHSHPKVVRLNVDLFVNTEGKWMSGVFTVSNDSFVSSFRYDDGSSLSSGSAQLDLLNGSCTLPNCSSWHVLRRDGSLAVDISSVGDRAPVALGMAANRLTRSFARRLRQLQKRPMDVSAHLSVEDYYADLSDVVSSITNVQTRTDASTDGHDDSTINGNTSGINCTLNAKAQGDCDATMLVVGKFRDAIDDERRRSLLVRKTTARISDGVDPVDLFNEQSLLLHQGLLFADSPLSFANAAQRQEQSQHTLCELVLGNTEKKPFVHRADDEFLKEVLSC